MQVVIIDPYLKSYAGHCYAYDRSILSELKKRNIPASLYAADTVINDIREEIGAIPSLRQLSGGKASILPHKLLGIFKELKTIFNSLVGSSCIFFPNIFTGKQLLVLSIFFLFYPPGKNRRVILLYRFVPEHPQQVSLYRLAGWLMRRKIKQKSIILATDSEVIAQKCLSMLAQQVHVLPIPHVHTILSSPRTTNVINVYLPGEARVDKGILTLLEAIGLMSEENAFKDYCFTVQYNPLNPDRYTKQVGDQLQQLQKIANIRILSVLDSEAYNAELSNADIVLVNYFALSRNGYEGYYARTSGIFSEAIAAEKPLVTTRGTWMSLQAEQLQSGVSIEDDSAIELKDAIIKLGNSIEVYREKAKAAAKKWVTKHNASSFCNEFLLLCK